MKAIDLFAGPGGWDIAARRLGVEPLGIEWDDAACATRRANGLSTVQANVAALDPMDLGPCDLLIASPPCQAFSMAGRGEGRDALADYVAAVERWALDEVPSRDEREGLSTDGRADLVLEPLRWALEQVPPILPGRRLDEPAPTVMFGNSSNEVCWVRERPATTVLGSRVAAPGHQDRSVCGSQFGRPGTARVTPREAAALQTFPSNYKWRGSRSKRFEQIGNAIPPLLAEHVLRAALPVEAALGVAA